MSGTYIDNQGNEILIGGAGHYVNCPYSILDFKWSDHILNNVSWLRADTFSWQSGNLYQAVYQHLESDISKIPEINQQNVKLEINDSAVILKAGSKVCVPNGDGRFDDITISVDLPNSTTGSGEKMFLLVYNNGANLFAGYMTGGKVSERPSSPINYALYYNITTNKCEFYNGSTWISDCSLPIAIYTRGTIGAISGATSIDQVFNGVNYFDRKTETISGINIDYFEANDGHKICLPNQESNVNDLFTATGVAWYYILDKDNRRFKLPRTKYDFVGLRDSVGNYVSESLPNIKGDYSNLGSKDPVLTTATGVFKVTQNTYLGNQANAGIGSGIGFDASLSSSTYQDNAPVQQRSTQMYLYFYVGVYEQKAIEQTAGMATEVLNTRLGVEVPHIKRCVETATGGYVVYSNGYYEEWGEIDYSSSGSGFIVTSFSKTFSKTPNVQITLKGIVYNNYLNAQHSCNAKTVSTTAFTTYIDVNVKNKFWKACGFLAEGQY